MEIEQALRTRLLASSGLSTLIGQAMFAQEAHQDQAPPYVLYSTADYEQMESLAGWINLYSQTWLWECYGGSWSQSKAIAREIRSVLYSTLQVRAEICDGSDLEWCGVEEQGGGDEIEPPIDAEGRGLDYVNVMARIWWRVI